MHLRLGKIPDGSNLMAAVLNEMRLENNQNGEDETSVDDVITVRADSLSSDDVCIGAIAVTVTKSRQASMKVNTSPKRK